MKNEHISKLANFFAFNLLFFALYLNFIHQDSDVTNMDGSSGRSGMQGVQLVEKPAQTLDKANLQQNEKTVALKATLN